MTSEQASSWRAAMDMAGYPYDGSGILDDVRFSNSDPKSMITGTSEQHTDEPPGLSVRRAKFVAVLELSNVPFWMFTGPTWRIQTASTETASFLASALCADADTETHPHALLFSIPASPSASAEVQSPSMILLYASSSGSSRTTMIYARALRPTPRSIIPPSYTPIKPDPDAPPPPSPNARWIAQDDGRRTSTLSKFDEVLNRKRKRGAPLERLAGLSRRSSLSPAPPPVPVGLKKEPSGLSRIKREENVIALPPPTHDQTPVPAVPSNTTTTTETPLPKRFESDLKRQVLTTMRMHSITSQHPDYKMMYSTTKHAAIFALRNDLAKVGAGGMVRVERMRGVVEGLVGMFVDVGGEGGEGEVREGFGVQSTTPGTSQGKA
ncbi:hypothetical protein SAICODRAFT_21851 [Saitoella complicata NRRL Y-17804]|uniref:uncharacterized protein n=1 Tax=Saitoella complicata (strain BCRC 22490 / CBS 7301 / JCM 7358 / NBRC 10748 / NRRL Y-17804) TaxID=698492 RepID=UPI0008675E7F|nr:uncharacterized protein SAICODRAFT_21851 [Saitoella complicata NRRL Y-17804]ODQ50102.1 hypothetical protein SAICODRAFT_21851 [Saitoella complicata NRRL Y-17804]